MALDELSIIDRFFRPLAGEGAFGLMDDAAQLAVPRGCDLVVTTDMIAAGVHFLADDPPETIARKALRVNLSDLAGKGAKPLAYTLALGLQDDVEEAWLTEFAKGLARGSGAVRDRPARRRHDLGRGRAGRLGHRVRLRAEGADGASLRRPARRRALRVRHDRFGRGRARAAQGLAGPVERACGRRSARR